MDSLFSQRLKTLREERGLTMQKLGEEIGTSGVSIGYYERGERVPDIHILAKMCQFFGVTSDYLIGLEDCRTHEAVDINKRLGLSEQAIHILEKCAIGERNFDFDCFSFLQAIDELIEDEELLVVLGRYLLGAPPDKNKKTMFCLCTRKDNTGDASCYEDVTYSDEGQEFINAMNMYSVQKALEQLKKRRSYD